MEYRRLGRTGVSVSELSCPDVRGPSAPLLSVAGYEPPSSEETCSASDGTTSELITAGFSKFCD